MFVPLAIAAVSQTFFEPALNHTFAAVIVQCTLSMQLTRFILASYALFAGIVVTIFVIFAVIRFVVRTV